MQRFLSVSICLAISSCCGDKTPTLGSMQRDLDKDARQSQKHHSSPAFIIHYSNADLNTTEIVDYQMTLTWHTLKRGLGVTLQNLNSYDLHSTNIKLSQKERTCFEKWIKENQIFSFKDYYPPSEPGSYTAAFESSLHIKTGTNEKTISWDDTSNCPKLHEAIKKLCKLTKLGNK
jgi:hypothetical protein